MTNFKIAYPDIPLSSSITRDDDGATNENYKNLVLGDRRSGFERSSGSAEPLDFVYDLGSGSAQAAAFVAFPRANTLRAAGNSSINVLGLDYSSTSPSTLLGSNLKLWLTAEKSVTTDSYGRVSSWLDQSATAATAAQSTDANKPILSRCDDKENWALYSEQFDNAYWSKSATSITANSISNPVTLATTADKLIENGSAGNHRLISTAITGMVSGQSYRASIYAKAGARTRFEFYIGLSGFPAGPGGSFDVSAGTVSNLNGAACTITALDHGWYRCTVTATAGATGSARFDIYMLNGAGSNNYTGDGTSDLYFFGAQFQRAAASSRYIATTETRVYRGVNGRRCISFDGDDDVLQLGAMSTYFTNSAYTVWAVLRPRTSGTNQTASGSAWLNDAILASGTGGSNWYWGLFLASSGLALVANYDGTQDDCSSALSFNQVSVVESRHESGTVYVSVNGAGEGSAASGNTSSVAEAVYIGYTNSSSTAKYAEFDLCEVIVANSAIGSSDRASIRAYLTAKWSSSTTQHQSTTLDDATLYGPRSEDWFSYDAAATTTRRYWWVTIGSEKSTAKGRHSKHFIGSLFDFGRDPHYSISIKGEAESNSAREAPITLSCEWRGITDTILNSFISNVVKYSDVGGLMLYDPAAAVMPWRVMHVRLKSFTSKPTAVNTNTVNCVFEELI